MGVKRFIFCFFSVAILATTTLPNAYAGPYDKEIGDLQKQIDELNSEELQAPSDVGEIASDIDMDKLSEQYSQVSQNYRRN